MRRRPLPHITPSRVLLLPASTPIFFFFFFNDTATTEIYTLSLHDALPISHPPARRAGPVAPGRRVRDQHAPDRKSTRLNSSHSQISYAVFCLKKKKKIDGVLPYRMIPTSYE